MMTSLSTADPKNWIWRESLNISLPGALSPGGFPPRGRHAVVDARHHAHCRGLAGPGERIPRERRGATTRPHRWQDAAALASERGALHAQLDGERDGTEWSAAFCPGARRKDWTRLDTSETGVGIAGSNERVLLFDDAADPLPSCTTARRRRTPNCSPASRELVVKRAITTMWFRERVLADVVPYDTSN